LVQLDEQGRRRGTGCLPGDAQFCLGVRQVPFNGSNAQIQAVSDGLVGQALRNELATVGPASSRRSAMPLPRICRRGSRPAVVPPRPGPGAGEYPH
jgi:hypothetical protein